MRVYQAVFLVCAMCSLASAEYKELEALRESSQRVLATYAEQLAGEEAKFEGVVEFGRTLKAVEAAGQVDVPKLTYQSKAYWRAVLEMTPRDSSILFAHAHLHAARGQTDWADIYFLIGSVTDAKAHRQELGTYKRLRDGLNARAGRDIKTGIGHHDRRQYQEAIKVYDEVIAEHPSCTLACYEKGLSYMMMSKSDPAMKEQAMAMYGECRKRDPFFWKAYQGGDPNVIEKLTVCLEKVQPFVSGKQRSKEGFIAFAEGCEAMQLYPLAAHVHWKLALVDSDNFDAHLRSFLDLIEKSGCEDAAFFRRQFRLSPDK